MLSARFQGVYHWQVHFKYAAGVLFKLLSCCNVHFVLVLLCPAHTVLHFHLAFDSDDYFLVSIEPPHSQHGALAAELFVWAIVEQVLLSVKVLLVCFEQLNYFVMSRSVCQA